MEVVAFALIWCLTILLPVNGLIFMATRAERKKNKHLLMALWKMSGKLPRR